MKRILGVLGISVIAGAIALGQMAPQPDKDGIYTAGKGLTLAKLTLAVVADYSSDPHLAGIKRICAVRVVVGTDGTPGTIQVLNEKVSPFDDAAIAAVKQSHFEPAMYQGAPVPTYSTLWVPFNVGKEPAVPVEGRAGQKGVSPPMALDSVAAENSELARNGKLPGVVWVSMLVTESGLPRDVYLVHPLGNGHDQDVLNAAQKYRFRPATFHGVPVPFSITIEVNSHSY
ncbi:MAG: energy transducer TonB [Terracidiphilus sp.]|jgi:TonB family protein